MIPSKDSTPRLARFLSEVTTTAVGLALSLGLGRL